MCVVCEIVPTTITILFNLQEYNTKAKRKQLADNCVYKDNTISAEF